MDRYFWLTLGKYFLLAFFPVSFFLRPRRKLHWKKTRRNSVNENLSNVRRNTTRTLEKWSKMETVADLDQNRPKSTNSVTGKHGKRFEDIKNSYGRQVGYRTSKKNWPSAMCGNLILDSLDVGLHSSKFSDK